MDKDEPKKNVFDLFAGNGKEDKVAEACRDLEKNAPLMLKYYLMRAALQRSVYLEYVRQGFTEQQALELIKGVI